MTDAGRTLLQAVLVLCLASPAVGAAGATMNHPAPAAAEPPAPSPAPSALTPQERSLQGFGAQLPNCLEWGDSCSVCQRDDSGAMHCSTPGIACQPETIVCRREKAN